MIKKETTISFKCAFSKLMACVVFFCVITSSTDVGFNNLNISVMQSAKVSADTLISHFFHLSTFPVDVISKMFNEVANTAAVKANNMQSDKKEHKEEGNSAKASLGYSILPNSFNLLGNTNIKTFLKFNKYTNQTDSLLDRNREYYSVLKTKITGSPMLFIIALLFLAILLTRKNMGSEEDSIIIKNNIEIARL